MPHHPVLPLEPFQKWGLDFVGPFKPAAMRTGNRYIIVVYSVTKYRHYLLGRKFSFHVDHSGMVYSVTKYRHYLLGRKFSFHVDHSALLYLVSKASLTGKIARWTLLLQEFEFDIFHRPGVQHAVADYLSRLEFGEASNDVQDEFPDAELFRITTEPATDATVADEDKWLTEMHQFLSTGVPPGEHGSRREETGSGEKQTLLPGRRHPLL